MKCHVYHHVGGRRHTPVVCNESRKPHTSHYPSNENKQPTNFFKFTPSIRYHGSSSSIKYHVYHHVGGRRHTPMVCNDGRKPHTSNYYQVSNHVVSVLSNIWPPLLYTNQVLMFLHSTARSADILNPGNLAIIRQHIMLICSKTVKRRNF